MNRNNYFTDGRLDVVVLGPMDNKKEVGISTTQIGDAIKKLLKEEPAVQFLLQAGISISDVHMPPTWDDPEIVDAILQRIDIADIVIVNITPKDGPEGAPSPNVFYELGLIHSLGLPVIMVCQKGTQRPFYIRTVRIHELSKEGGEAGIMDTLRVPLFKFLDINDDTDFTSNKVTQFYKGLPVVDISAAVGLATGYYYNFVGRLLREGLFVSAYPGKIKQVVVVRPDSILNMYSEDRRRMEQVLADAKYKMQTDKLDEPAGGDQRGPIWIDNVDGVVIDLPRTIYPLKISPKLLTMQDRFDRRMIANKQRYQIQLRQHCELLLDRVEHGIHYHVNRDSNLEGMLKNRLHFARIDELPALLLRLGIQPNA